MTDERAVQLAVKLQLLGVSRTGIIDLLAHCDHDVIERQLRLLPLRKVKRPAAFIVEAIRKDYSPPNDLYYAPTPPRPSPGPAVDEGAQPPPRPPHAAAAGHGAEDPPHPPAPDDRLEPSGTPGDPLLPATHAPEREGEPRHR